MRTVQPPSSVAVIRGGLPGFTDRSVKSGAEIMSALGDDVTVHDILVDASGTWNYRGLPKRPDTILPLADVVINVLHGHTPHHKDTYETMRRHHSRVVGSHYSPHVYASLVRIADALHDYKIRTPRLLRFERGDANDDEIVKEVFNTFSFPLAVSFRRDEQGGIIRHLEALKTFLYHHPDTERVFVREHITGDDFYVALLEGYRGQSLYTSLPINRDGSLQRLDLSRRQRIERASEDLHKLMGMKDYSLIHCVLSPTRGLYVDFVDNAPELHADAPFRKAMDHVGVDTGEFVRHIVSL